MLSVNKLSRGIPLKLFFTAPLLMLFIFIAVSIGVIAYLSSQYAATQFSQQLAFQVSKRTHEQLDLLVSVPQTILNNSVKAVENGLVDLQSEAELIRYLVMQISNSPYITFVAIGLANGQYLAINRHHTTGQLSLLSSYHASDLRRTRYSLQANGLKGESLEVLDEFDATHRPWFTQALSKGAMTWYPVYQYASGEGFGIGVSAPVFSNSGELQAVVAVDFGLSLVSSYLQSLQLGTAMTVFTVGPRGNIIAASKPESDLTADDVNRLIPASESNNPLIRAAAKQMAVYTGKEQLSFEVDGQDFLLNVAEYRDPLGLDFKTVVLIPKGDLLSSLDKYLYNALWLILLAITLGALLALLLSRRLIKPIEAMHRYADQLALGKEGNAKLPESEVYELNGLILSFKLMANNMAASFSQLEFKALQDAATLQQFSLDAMDRQQRTERQRSALAQLVLDDAVAQGDGQAFIRNLTRITADALICQRVSVWMMSDVGEKMHCVALHDGENIDLKEEIILTQVEYPQYFAAIAKHGWICANNALTDSATIEFADLYLKPLGISAMLDAGILIAGKVVGIICLEHVGGARQWQPDEEAFVAAAAAVLAQVISVAQQKQAERSSKEHAEHTQTILNSVVDGIITMDSDGQIVSLNPAAIKLFGGKESDYLGCHVTLMLSAILTDPQRIAENYFPSPGKVPLLGVLRELDAVQLNGSIFAIELALSVITRQGKFVYIATVRDISERKRLERLKNEFVSTVSHELRTPLTSITGAIGLVKSGKLGVLSEKADQLVTVAYKNCQNLTLLVNDLLDFEKISAGKMIFDMQPEWVLPMLQKAIEANKVMASQKHISLQLNVQNEDCKICVDAHRLMQVLSNFLSNAIKFSPETTTVQINLSVQDQQARIAIIDCGPGIAESFHGKIFQRFSQADSSDSRAIGGTGLGLAISKELVNGMQGEIGFESVAGQGATFYCCFAIV
ncbi:ATP-binding protein [Arsukibacterium ikkense]|uniref:ATP-binding protein n=1 Tax=Arsukibacterium ikkense TaxID=336831 RepID=UPI00069BFF84|nr:ATP-binding protein [Arsukibacterium ikkense]